MTGCVPGSPVYPLRFSADCDCPQPSKGAIPLVIAPACHPALLDGISQYAPHVSPFNIPSGSRILPRGPCGGRDTLY
jgi:hypothetical protein